MLQLVHDYWFFFKSHADIWRCESLTLVRDGWLYDALGTNKFLPPAPASLFHLTSSLLFYTKVNRVLVQVQRCNIDCPFRLHNLYPAWWGITESQQPTGCLLLQTDRSLYWVWIMIHNSLSHTGRLSGTSGRQIIEYFSIGRARYLLQWTKTENLLVDSFGVW